MAAPRSGEGCRASSKCSREPAGPGEDAVLGLCVCGAQRWLIPSPASPSVLSLSLEQGCLRSQEATSSTQTLDLRSREPGVGGW